MDTSNSAAASPPSTSGFNKSREPKSSLGGVGGNHSQFPPSIEANTSRSSLLSGLNNSRGVSSPPSIPAEPTGDELELLERQKRIVQNDMLRVLQKFEELKHRLFTNKERLIENELSQLDSHSHPGLKQQLDEAESLRVQRLGVAGLKRKFALAAIGAEYDASVASAQLLVHEGKKNVRRALVHECQSQLMNLMEEMKAGSVPSNASYNNYIADQHDNSSLSSGRSESGVATATLLPRLVTSLSKREIELDMGSMAR